MAQVEKPISLIFCSETGPSDEIKRAVVSFSKYGFVSRKFKKNRFAWVELKIHFRWDTIFPKFGRFAYQTRTRYETSNNVWFS